MLTSIPTVYNGVQFRSRAEARWALCFDELNLEWEYEPEGYQLPTYWYLPDFWFPRIRCFGEVKAVTAQWDDEALIKACELSIESGCPVLMFDELSYLNPLIPICAPYLNDDALRVHLLYSRERGRPWFDFDGGIEDELVLHEWGCACSVASAKRFGRT